MIPFLDIIIIVCTSDNVDRCHSLKQGFHQTKYPLSYNENI